MRLWERGCVSLDVQLGPGCESQRPGSTLHPHHNDALLKRSMDHGRRRDDGEVSLLASDEGIPDPPQLGHDLSQVCYNPVPDILQNGLSMRLLLPM